MMTGDRDEEFPWGEEATQGDVVSEEEVQQEFPWAPITQYWSQKPQISPSLLTEI